MENEVIFQQQLTSSHRSELGSLTAKSLFWWHNGQIDQVLLKDVVGIMPFTSACDNLPGLRISSFSPLPHQPGQLKRRELVEHELVCVNLEIRSQWQKAIKNTLRGKPIDADIKPRHLQIIINPVSGQQKAIKVFEQVQFLFERSNLQYTVTHTRSADDTKNIARHLDLAATDGLVIVGGDGTIHDAIAGLMSRPDAQTAIKLPLGIIPGGTGNGLCKTLLESAGEIYDPCHAAFLIIKGQQRSLDLGRIQQNNVDFYSFLSLSWGLISDVDIESEKLKFLGAWRFDLYALLLIFSLRTYKGRFSFIPHPDCKIVKERAMPSASYAIATAGEWRVIEDDFIFLWGMNTAWAAHDMNVTPYAQLNDGAMDVLIMRKGTSRLEILQALLRCGKGQHLDLPNMEYYKVSAFRLEPLTEQGILVVDGEQIDYSAIAMEIIPNLARVNC